MKQTDLNRAIARATGETVERIGRMGFGLIVPPVPRHQRRRRWRPRRRSRASMRAGS